jgi:hypothetical protein
MSSFVVRIDDMGAFIDSWQELLKNPQAQVFTVNNQVFQTLDEWPRIKFFYYCDDQDGNTIRLYDTEHFNHFGGSSYLEPDGYRKEHFERVIIRGRNMWSGDQAALNRPDSLRNRFRTNRAWKRFSARGAPLRAGTHPPPQLGMPIHRGTVDIQGGMLRERRLWYFESVNQLPAFDPAEVVVPGLPPAPAMSVFERLRALREAGQPKT